MINRIRNLIRNRHNIAVFILLNAACAVWIGLVLARVAYSDSGRHVGLIWNLFLAWIPFILLDGRGHAEGLEGHLRATRETGQGRRRKARSTEPTETTGGVLQHERQN